MAPRDPRPTGLLEALGVPEAEEAAYLSVLAAPESTVAAVAAELALPAERAGELLRSLTGRGLLHRLAEPPARWAAIAPDLAVQALLLRREAELCRLRGRIGELMRTHRTARRPAAAELVEVVTGPAVIAGHWRRMLAGARHRVLLFDKPPHLVRADPGLELGLLDRGVRVRVVYEAGSVSAPGRLAEIREFTGAGEQARVLPELPCKLAVVDDSWAMLPLCTGSELHGAMLVRASSLLDALAGTFEAYWNRAVRIPGPRAAECTPGSRHTELLTLLCAGFTDDSIARQLGVSPRTVQRRVRELMDSLGARTRFQAGIQAARAGLL
ncbi:helix-turn-helix domain-containing protein [Streptomyces orinoci]|uniref:Helix-turn-helix domain-containing protein n=1 Tax=Streptomyces orinoci TaxID=67339 RepID=A0ABV3K5D6_STRON|nr:helix-turn-helix domain-containing protein [Streptomyces orinoci]